MKKVWEIINIKKKRIQVNKVKGLNFNQLYFLCVWRSEFGIRGLADSFLSPPRISKRGK